MNPNKITEIRKLIEQSQESGNRPHYSDAIKSLAKTLLKNGVSRSELANATGISRATLANWTKGSEKTQFRKIKVGQNPELQSSQLKVSLPSGVSIECSSVTDLKSILELCS